MIFALKGKLKPAVASPSLKERVKASLDVPKSSPVLKKKGKKKKKFS